VPRRGQSRCAVAAPGVWPTGSSPRRIRLRSTGADLAVFDFELTAEDDREIAALETGERIGPDPNAVGEKPSGFSTEIDQSLA
jgi:diketogulonate reductase-like aldo/keto reductase